MKKNAYEEIKSYLIEHQFSWLITGVAGFIGSHLLEELLMLNQKVIGIDNFATGYKHNIDEVLDIVPSQYKNNFTFYEGDICSLSDCERVVSQAQYVLHQAAIGSVPRSLKDPFTTNDTNVTGFLNILNTAKNHKVKRLVYASSSSVYGDSAIMPKREESIGNPLSPYAVSKMTDELYAKAFASCFGMETIGLRYFNVFGSRQDPNGAYAAVIPIWAKSIIKGEPVFINGDGTTTRDFCYVKNVVQANLLSAMALDLVAVNKVYNVAYGEATSLSELCSSLFSILNIKMANVENRDFREGDIKHSLADISNAKNLLGYSPEYSLYDGLKQAMPWYVGFFNRS